jgi:Zn-dependent protease with chaperone function
MSQHKDAPFSYKIPLWYNFIFASVYLIYGGVKIILSILDRNYYNMDNLIMFTIIGLVLITFAFAYRELKRWGWHGLIIINALIMVGSVFFILQVENIVLFVFSAIVLYFLIKSTTREYINSGL